MTYDPSLKLGLIAGGGNMPLEVIEAVQAHGGEIHVLGIQGAVADNLKCHDTFPVEHIGKFLKAFKKAGCEQLVIIGNVQRPNLLTLRPDFEGLRVLARVLFNTKRGDDVLLREVVNSCNQAGLEVLPAYSVAKNLSPEAGNLTEAKPDATDRTDMALGIEVTRAVGRMDIGQGSVVCRGQVLAVEGVDGTDALLHRIAALEENLRGSDTKPQGVLVKLPKPQQDRRIDVPAFGLNTIENAANANLSGIVFEVGGAVFNDLPGCIKRADELGLFLYGIGADTGDDTGS
ncbi:MAG: LpxI family protein [Parvibaculales bacterium]